MVKASSGTSLVLVLSALDAVEKWRKMVGPNRVVKAEWFFPMSMRVQFGLLDEIPEAVHASDSFVEAVKESRYFNPESKLQIRSSELTTHLILTLGILEPITSEEDKVQDYLAQYVNPTLINGLVEIVRVKPVDPVLHLAEWLLRNNPYQPQLPEEISNLST